MKDVRALSEKRVILSTSTLYTALKRLLEQGWIRREDDPAASRESGRERKVYGLTELGRRVLETEVERLDSLVFAARQRAAGQSV